MADNFVLMVEDSENDVALAERAFRRCGVREKLIVTWDGVEALDFLFCRNRYAGRDPIHLPTLILLDLKLPRINGLEVLKQIRTDPRTAGLPVIVLTSSSEEKDLAASYALGVNKYFCKPVEFDTFIQLIQRIKEEWLDTA